MVLPLHPFLVHFPIALLPFSFVCEVTARIWNREEVSVMGWWIQLGGTIGLFLAVGSGLLTERDLGPAHPAQASFLFHEQLAFVTAVLFAALLFWRIASRSRIPQTHATLYLLLFGAGVLLLVATAWFGGELVYRFGVGRFS